ncbi:F0F1 ATP synthase subunit delta, partial [Laribacter hongkongensis]
MAELITVARPYAEAVFRLAKDEGRLAQWSEALAWLAASLAEPAVSAAVANPERTEAEVVTLLGGILGDKAGPEVRNLLEAL